ncbi:MAG TPA: pentapeptide repeat-containing protein, partial [Micromonosporaceae bacterium]|nr:pentapeptide repeat-containing protein [Micromonosporaceae bacterium]
MVGPEHAIVRILRSGRPVGLGFHVGDGILLTCAHVVNTALGRKARDRSDPGDTRLTVDIALGGPAAPEVVVQRWYPRPDGSFDEQDVAVLRCIGQPPSGLSSLRLAEGDLVVGEVQAFGPSAERSTPGHVRGLVLGAVDGSRLQVNQHIEGIFRIRSGFSGGPVWQAATGQVVGALQAVGVGDGATDTYVVSASVLSKALRDLPELRRTSARNPNRAAEVCLLHLADLQFGAQHGFGGDGLTEADRRHDRLAGRLLEDLSRLRERHGVTPDLVTVAGDIAEWALPKEYEAAYEFLDDLATGLGLSRDRIVLVPGNHDVNRKKCQAYFLSREGEGEKAVRPYWPKWEPYASFVERFHGHRFPKDEPWTYHEFPDLKLVIAGLNSTMAESHKDTDHYGWLGEQQLRWFAERLKRARERGWLRLAVLHHNPVRGASHDDANLRDADRLSEVLGAHLHSVLHGHTHDARVTHLGSDGLPVIGTGSTGVRHTERPPDVSNQYQLVRFTGDGVDLWARRFDPQRRKWVGDTGVSEDGDDWRHRIPVRWAAAHGAFPSIETTSVKERRARSSDDRFGGKVAEDLLSRIAEVYRLREPASIVEEAGGGSEERYLRVSRSLSIGPDHPPVMEQFPIGALRGPVTVEQILRFHGEIDARFRLGGAAVGSKLIYDGDPADAELHQLARLKGVELLSFAEYQLGYDLRPYAVWQADELAKDPIYPAELYIPQRYSGLHEQKRHEDLLAELRRWLADPDGQFVLVLGDFGYGKTFLLRELARRMHTENDPAVPVLVQLRKLEKTHQLNQLVAAQLTLSGMRRIEVPLFRYLLRQGRIALLFDGYDELAHGITYERATEHLNTIIQAAEGRAKVVLTSRDNYFLTDNQVTNALGDKLAVVSGRRIVRLQGFDEGQILAFLTRLLGDETKARHRLDLLENVRDLLGLSRNPRMLSFIGQIEEHRLLEAKQRQGEITAAALYRALLDQWIEYEWRRLGRPAAPSRDELWQAVVDLAMRMWQAPGEELGINDLQESAETLTALTSNAGEATRTAAETSHLLGSSTLLVRDPDGSFRFVHRSVLEWLVASESARQLNQGIDRPDLLSRSMSPLMVDFLADLAGAETAARWGRSVLTAAPDTTATSENAEKILKRLGTGVQGARLSGQDLRGRDLSGMDLRGADLRNTDLTEATLTRADLSGADLSGATLVRTRLDRAILTGAMLRDADLTGARLLEADLTDAELAGARLRMAALIGAKLATPQLAGLELAGAARDDDAVSRQLAPMRVTAGAVEFSPDSGLIASGSAAGTITVWNAATGQGLRELTGHLGWVNAVAWSPDGTRLATASDDNTVRLWDPATGTQIRELTGHTDWVRAVAWSPDGTLLATASSDKTVRLWDPATGTQKRELTGHTSPVWTVAWSPDGTLLATASDDNTIRLWN